MPLNSQALTFAVFVGVSVSSAHAAPNSSPQPKSSQQPKVTTVLVPSGTFQMGCFLKDPHACSFFGDKASMETTKVVITRPFVMMKTEVTQDLYKSVMGKYSSPKPVCVGTCPANKVNWYDAVRFANTLSKLKGVDQCYLINERKVEFKGLDCTGWRLPTEAEWEYAARGGQDFVYAGSNKLKSVGWTLSNPMALHKACELAPNGYGLCDMSGNVSEWVWDGRGIIVKNKTLTDPLGDESSEFRVHRGGSYRSGTNYARVFARDGARPKERDSNYGFRLVRTGQNKKR